MFLQMLKNTIAKKENLIIVLSIDFLLWANNS